jgi:hypothetical protein
MLRLLMNNELGKDMKRSGRGLIKRYYSDVSLEGLRKTTNILG